MVGLPTVAFNRGETVRNGAGWFQINAAEDGTRMSSSHAYLHPILGTRPNLEVRTDCWVREILFDDAQRAPECATSGPTSPATTRCPPGARSSSRPGPSTPRSC